MNYFYDDLAFSHEQSEANYWLNLYKKTFPTLVSITDLSSDGIHQRKGIDKAILLSNSKVVYIDEKVRRANYGDIALEYISNDVKNTDGWVCKDLLCDYIAYVFLNEKQMYLLPVVQLQSAWRKNKKAWLELYKTKKAKNNGYNTLFCPVPINTLYAAIGSELRANNA